METKLIRRKVLGVVAAATLAVVSVGAFPVPHAAAGAADPPPPTHTPRVPPSTQTPDDVRGLRNSRACYYERGKLLYCERDADPIVEPAPKSSALV